MTDLEKVIDNLRKASEILRDNRRSYPEAELSFQDTLALARLMQRGTPHMDYMASYSNVYFYIQPRPIRDFLQDYIDIRIRKSHEPLSETRIEAVTDDLTGVNKDIPEFAITHKLIEDKEDWKRLSLQARFAEKDLYTYPTIVDLCIWHLSYQIHSHLHYAIYQTLNETGTMEDLSLPGGLSRPEIHNLIHILYERLHTHRPVSPFLRQDVTGMIIPFPYYWRVPLLTTITGQRIQVDDLLRDKHIIPVGIAQTDPSFAFTNMAATLYISGNITIGMGYYYEKDSYILTAGLRYVILTRPGHIFGVRDTQAAIASMK